MDTVVDSLVSKLDRKVVVSLDIIDWENAGKRLQWAVLMKFANGRSLQKKPLEDILNNVWKISSPAVFYKVERNTPLVNFKSEEDQKRVLNGGPWSFDGNAIILQKWESGMMEEDFQNTKINIWIQVRRLPFEFRNYDYASMLASYAVELVDMDSENPNKKKEFSGQYVRIRIRLDTSKPVYQGLFLTWQNRKLVWIVFKYEKLPSMCFKCGLLNHDSRGCMYGSSKIKAVYGTWIRAETNLETTPEWRDDRTYDTDVMVVTLPESHVPEDSGEVQSKTVRIEETPKETVANEHPSNITATFSNLLPEIIVPNNMMQVDTLPFYDIGQRKVTNLTCANLEGVAADFNLSFPDKGDMMETMQINSVQKQNFSSGKGKEVFTYGLQSSKLRGDFFKDRKKLQRDEEEVVPYKRRIKNNDRAGDVFVENSVIQGEMLEVVLKNVECTVLAEVAQQPRQGK